MTPIQAWDTLLWRRARGVFDQLLVQQEEGATFDLESVCKGDPALLGAVQALLQHDRSTRGEIAGRPPSPSLPETGQRWLGTCLGPYRLSRVLGHGGAGIVFLGHRADQEFEHRVAVKILLDAFNAEALRRFRQERQILAQFDHPNIAHLIDGGTTDDGSPYVVMEYVAGLLITTYCDQQRLALRQRLRLFLQVCSAVQQAHRYLVIHRDLKPSNVLVTDDGQVKLLDFGIAKLLAEAAPAGQVAETADGHTRTCAWLTPAYASPEQLLGTATSMATDVYSLGALLYELLTGRLAHATLGRGNSLHEAVPVPSSVVLGPARPENTSGAAPGGALEDTDFEALAGLRAVSVSQLSRQLRGDLDHLLLRALRDEPQSRYPSVEALASDIERHLDDQPVSARRGTTRYRMGKFLRRHALASSFGLLLVLSLVAFAAFASWNGVVLARERDATERQRVAAETVADNLVELVRTLRPHRGPAFDPAIRRILGQATDRVREDLAGEGELQVVLNSALANVYRQLAYLDEAEPLAEQVLAYRQQTGTARDLAVASFNLALLRAEQGRVADAETLVRKALELRRGEGDGGPAVLVSTLSALGAYVEKQGRDEEAIPLLREAIVIGDRSPEVDPRRRAEPRNSLGKVLSRRGERPAARQLFAEALAFYKEASGESSLDVSSVLNNLAGVEVTEGDYASAAQLFRDSLEIRRQLQGDQHPDVTTVSNNLAVCLHLSGDYQAAEPVYRANLSRSLEAHGRDHRIVASDSNNLGILLREMGQLDEAEELLRDSLRIRAQIPDADPLEVATNRNNLGLVLLDRGQLAAARHLFEQSLDDRQRILGAEHWQVGNSLSNLAKVSLAQGDPCEAAQLAQRAAKVTASALSADHWRHAEAQSVLGLALARLGRRAEAETLLQSSSQVIVQAKGEAARSSRDAMQRLASVRAGESQAAPNCPTRSALPCALGDI